MNVTELKALDKDWESAKEQAPSIVNLTEERERLEDENLLELDKTANGKGFARTLANLCKILLQDNKLKGAIKLNQFTNEVELVKVIKLSDNIELKGRLTDLTCKQLRRYVSKKYKIEYDQQAMIDGVEVVADEQGYNPVKEFLLECEQVYNHAPSKKEPFELVKHYLNIKDTEHNRIVVNLIFKGAVARVLQPGIKFDFVLDLTGAQGVGKTQFLNGLFMGKITMVDSFTEKDDKMKMSLAWCVLDDEMVATGSKKTNFEKMKRFVSETVLEYRPPYGTGIRQMKKNFIIARTTNEKAYLKDLTGSRRFLILEVFKDSRYKGREWNKEDLQLFWGGVMTAYRDNPSLLLTDEEENIVERERERYLNHDEDIEQLERYLKTEIPEKFYNSSIDGEDNLRRYFVYDTLRMGHHRNAIYKPHFHGDLVERDRINLADYFDETQIKFPSPTLKRKIKLYLNNLEGWEYKKSLKFGRAVTSGWVKTKGG